MTRPRVMLLALLLTAVLVNVVWFPTEDRSFHHTAIERADTGDIVELTLRLSNVEATHNVFARLGQIAPGTVVRVTDEGAFPPGSSFHERLVSLGRVERIEVIPRGAVPELESIDLDEHLVAEGEVWVQPGHARDGRPGYTWAIHADAGEPDEWLFVGREDRSPNWLFIDTRLLESGSAREGS